MMINLDCALSSGQACTTVAKSASTAALSAAPSDEVSEYPDDCERCSVPTGSTSEVASNYCFAAFSLRRSGEKPKRLELFVVLAAAAAGVNLSRNGKGLA